MNGLGFVTGGLVSGAGPSGSSGGGISDDFGSVVREWIIATTGIPSERVIYSRQNGPRPATPFAEVDFGDLLPLGAVDGSSTDFDDGADAGAEITVTTHGQRDIPITVRVYTDSAIGAASARALLASAQLALGQETRRAAFHAQGATVWDRGVVRTIPSVLDTRWEGRAELIIRLYVELQATETTGYIDKVEVTDEAPVNPIPPFTVDAS